MQTLIHMRMQCYARQWRVRRAFAGVTLFIIRVTPVRGSACDDDIKMADER